MSAITPPPKATPPPAAKKKRMPDRAACGPTRPARARHVTGRVPEGGFFHQPRLSFASSRLQQAL